MNGKINGFLLLLRVQKPYNHVQSNFLYPSHISDFIFTDLLSKNNYASCKQGGRADQIYKRSKGS